MSEIYTIKKWMPTLGFEPGAVRLRSEGATTELRGLMSDEWMEVHLVLTERRGLISDEWIEVRVILTVLFLEIYLQHIVDVAK